MIAKKGTIGANFVKPEALGSLATAAIAYAVSQGITLDELAQEIDISALDYASQDARLPDAVVGELMNVLTARLPERAIAIEIANCAPLSMLGGLIQGSLFASNLDAALIWFVENRSILADQSSVHLERSESEVALVVAHPCEAIDRGTTIEICNGVIWRVLNESTASKIPLIRVESKYEKEALSAAYETFFQAPVLFGTGRNALVFSPESLSVPIRHANPEMFDFIQRQFEDMRQKLQTDVYPVALLPLRRSIMDNATRGEYGSTAAAAAANLSLRTAQRLTAEYGTSLQELIDEIRLANAKNFLRNPEIKIETVAQLVGYADVRAFRRAFKRWTSLSPREYRNGILKK